MSFGGQVLNCHWSDSDRAALIDILTPFAYHPMRMSHWWVKGQRGCWTPQYVTQASQPTSLAVWHDGH